VSILTQEEHEELTYRLYDFGSKEWPEGIDEFVQLFEGVEDI